MIDVALLGIIRRWHLRDQIPIREIARRLGISRNTVRRYLRSETTEPSYAERRSSSGLDKYSVQLGVALRLPYPGRGGTVRHVHDPVDQALRDQAVLLRVQTQHSQ